METLIIISNFLILGLVLFAPILILLILKKYKIRRTLIIYSFSSLFIFGILIPLFVWRAYESDLILLEYYGYNMDGMNEFERYRNVLMENTEQVKNLETSIMGVGWQVKAIFAYISFIPYLIFIYVGKMIINRMKKKL